MMSCTDRVGNASLTSAPSGWGNFIDPIEEMRSLPNHCGKPCRRLKPPGGSLSLSFALTVSASDTLVVYVYVVSGVRSGWKISDENVINGADDGNGFAKET